MWNGQNTANSPVDDKSFDEQNFEQGNTPDMGVSGQGNTPEIGVFEQNMALPSAEDQARSDRVGIEALNAVNGQKSNELFNDSSENNEQLNIPELKVSIEQEQPVQEVQNIVTSEPLAVNNSNFSRNTEFSETDIHIVEQNIADFKKNPEEAYRILQENRDKYRYSSFGEGKAA